MHLDRITEIPVDTFNVGLKFGSLPSLWRLVAA
jgi:hypothetical protein